MVDPGICRECAFSANNTATLMDAHCNASLVNTACMVDDPGNWFNSNDKWIQFVFRMGCHLNGTWYSTQKKGECTALRQGVASMAPLHLPRFDAAGVVGSDAGAADCWWSVAEVKRTVNQSCVDNAVIQAVQKRRPECWRNCPGNTGVNVTQPCYLDCLFTTILGNSTQGVEPMDAEDITAAFKRAFAAIEHGGCPEVPTPPSFLQGARADMREGGWAAGGRLPLLRVDPYRHL